MFCEPAGFIIHLKLSNPCVCCLIANDENTLELLIILLVTGPDPGPWSPLTTVSAGHNKAWEHADKVTINLCWPRNYSKLARAELSWWVRRKSPYLVVRTWLMGLLTQSVNYVNKHQPHSQRSSSTVYTLHTLVTFFQQVSCFSLCKTQLAIKTGNWECKIKQGD